MVIIWDEPWLSLTNTQPPPPILMLEARVPTRETGVAMDPPQRHFYRATYGVRRCSLLCLL